MATRKVEQDQQQGRLEDLAAALVPEAIEWINELRRYRMYEGTDARYYQKARTGINLLGHSVRICATIENARSNELIAARVLSGDAPFAVAAAPGAKQIKG